MYDHYLRQQQELIVTDRETQDLAVIYFALKSLNIVYRRVYYKRWKGESFDEALRFY